MACSSTGLTRVTISGSGSALRRKTCADRRSSRRTGGQPPVEGREVVGGDPGDGAEVGLLGDLPAGQ
jgi:hypothetical protein